MGTDNRSLCSIRCLPLNLRSQSTCKSWLFYCAVWWPARPVWCPQQPCSAHPATTAPSSARTVSAVTLPTRCRKDTLTPPFHLLSSTWLTPSPSPTKCPPSQPPPPTLSKLQSSTEPFPTWLLIPALTTPATATVSTLLYIILNGKIVYQGGLGPMDYR